MLKVVIVADKCPEIWKRSKTILLFKGGDKKDCTNWRLISLASVLYRCIMARLTTCIFHCHSVSPLVSPFQKEFIPGSAGCLEHIAKANSKVLDAVSRKRTLFSITLDLRDAFGSVPHELISRTLTQMKFQKGLREFVGEAYNEVCMVICKGAEQTGSIFMRRGVKQGCPLSPLLFNLVIDNFVEHSERETC
jgi:hypothetical protein